MSSYSRVSRAITAAGLLGVLVSTYALFVELKADSDPGYKALCDISERASCTKVLTSKYAKGFGVGAGNLPNPIVGIAHYCLIIFLTTYDNKFLVQSQLLLALLAVCSSVYLASLLIFVLHDFCIVCVSTYLVNGAIAYLTYGKYKAIISKNK